MLIKMSAEEQENNVSLDGIQQVIPAVSLEPSLENDDPYYESNDPFRNIQQNSH